MKVVRPEKLNLLFREHLLCVGFGMLFGIAALAHLSTLFAVSFTYFCTIICNCLKLFFFFFDSSKRWKLSPLNYDYGVTYLRYFGRNLAGAVIVAPLVVTFPVPKSKPRQYCHASLSFIR